MRFLLNFTFKLKKGEQTSKCFSFIWSGLHLKTVCLNLFHDLFWYITLPGCHTSVPVLSNVSFHIFIVVMGYQSCYSGFIFTHPSFFEYSSIRDMQCLSSLPLWSWPCSLVSNIVNNSESACGFHIGNIVATLCTHQLVVNVYCCVLIFPSMDIWGSKFIK